MLCNMWTIYILSPVIWLETLTFLKTRRCLLLLDDVTDCCDSIKRNRYHSYGHLFPGGLYWELLIHNDVFCWRGRSHILWQKAIAAVIVTRDIKLIVVLFCLHITYDIVTILRVPQTTRNCTTQLWEDTRIVLIQEFHS